MLFFVWIEYNQTKLQSEKLILTEVEDFFSLHQQL